MKLESTTATATISLDVGGRLGSLVVDGCELLVTAADDDFHWGSYPMVPYAGRIDVGRFSFAGADYEMPITMAPHAIHGVAWGVPWRQVDDTTLEVELDDPWPFGGRAEQHFELTDTSLTMTLAVEAGADAMPAMVGWHPWFRRTIERGGQATLSFEPAEMYEVENAIPTGALVPVGPQPWDNCFVGVTSDPVVSWPGALDLTLSSSCDHWVVYTLPSHALCVEPQTGAPDEFNRTPRVLQPGERLEETFTLRWAIHGR